MQSQSPVSTSIRYSTDKPYSRQPALDCVFHISCPQHTTLDLQLDANKEAQLQLLPQERVLNVKPSWAQTSNETRVDLLSISLEELRLKAIDLADKAQKQAGKLS